MKRVHPRAIILSTAAPYATAAQIEAILSSERLAFTCRSSTQLLGRAFIVEIGRHLGAHAVPSGGLAWRGLLAKLLDNETNA